MTWKFGNEYVHLSGDKPYVRLEGTEGSAKDIKIRENAGKIEVYNVDTEEVIVTLTPAAKKGAVVVRIADISTTETLYLMLPKCTVTKIWSVLSGAIADVNATITAYRIGTALTNGVITIDYSGSGAGDIDSCTPTANNDFDGSTQYLKLVGGGESTNAVPVLVTVEFTMTD